MDQVVDPAKRYTSEQILAHPWVTGVVSDAPLIGTIGQLKAFNARRKLKAGINAVRTAVRVKMLTAAMREAKACSCVLVAPLVFFAGSSCFTCWNVDVHWQATEDSSPAEPALAMPVKNPMTAGAGAGAGSMG